MNRIIVGAVIAGLAGIGIIGTATAANADVPRCDAPVTSTTQATFTDWEPAGAVHQFDNVWRHDYTITVNVDGTFTGTGLENGAVPGWNDGWGETHDNTTETVTGTIQPDNHITFTATRSDGRTWTLTNAPTTPGMTDPHNGTSVNTTNTPTIEFRIVTPQFDVTTDAMNHGQYVSSQGGGKTAAHACAGMPLQSNKIKG